MKILIKDASKADNANIIEIGRIRLSDKCEFKFNILKTFICILFTKFWGFVITSKKGREAAILKFQKLQRKN